MLETTVPPGTSEKIIYPIIEKVFKVKGIKNKGSILLQLRESDARIKLL